METFGSSLEALGSRLAHFFRGNGKAKVPSAPEGRHHCCEATLVRGEPCSPLPWTSAPRKACRNSVSRAISPWLASADRKLEERCGRHSNGKKWIHHKPSSVGKRHCWRVPRAPNRTCTARKRPTAG